MDSVDVERMVGLVHRVQAAWDRYTVQLRLPEDGGWLTQGHPWDDYNRGRRFVPARRDPLAMSAAWDGVEEGLRELSVVAERLRAGRELGDVELTGAGRRDQRMGPYSPSSVDRPTPAPELGAPAQKAVRPGP